MIDNTSSEVDELLDSLHERFGKDLRSCVEYLPQSRTIHYLRDDLDQTDADSRLLRIEELYQAERLASNPITKDPELGILDASIHVFGEVFVIHLIDPAGRVVGFSVDADGVPELRTFINEWRNTPF